MGTYKVEKYVSGDDQGRESKKTVKICIACLWSFLVSMTGGLLLGYWEYKYHLTSSQLWMVPLSLVLLITPLIVWFALAVSEICNISSNEGDDTKTSQPVIKSAHDSIEDGDVDEHR